MMWKSCGRRAGRAAAGVLCLLMVLCGRAALAGRLEYTFTRHDPETWELHGLTEADFTPEGLRFSWPAGEDRKPKFIMGRKLFIDDLEVLATFDRDKMELMTQAVIVLDNARARRRAEMAYYTQPMDQGVISYGVLGYFKDGTSVGRMSGWQHGLRGEDQLRLRKVSKRVHGAFPAKHGEGLVMWQTAYYPRTEFDEDCDEFAVGFMVVPPAKGGATEIVLKSLALTGPQTGGRDVDTKTPRVLRFDFGPVDQEVGDGYLAVNQYTNYTPERGYGWKTDVKPMHLGEFKRLTNEESIAHGLEPSVAEEGWRVDADLVLNWCRLFGVRPLLSLAHGWDTIEELGKTYDLKTPQEKDLVYTVRHYGFPHNYRFEADQWERRGAVYVDDDLSTEFAVDVPDGRYNAILGVGFALGGPYWGAPTIFNIDAEGRLGLKGMNQNWARCDRFRINDIEVKDGQLNLRFYGDRRLAMNVVEPAVLGCGWLVNFLVLCPADDPEVTREEEWRLIMERSKRVRQLTFEPGSPAHVQLADGYMHLNGKPFLPILLQYGYAWPRTYYDLYTWANCYTEALASSEIGGSAAFFQRDWERMSMWDNYPWRAIASMNSSIRHGNLDFLYCENFVYIVPRAIEGEGGKLGDTRGRFNRWQVQPPLGSRLAMEILKESYTMISNQLKLHPANPGYYVYEEFVHPYDYGYDFQSLGRYREYLSSQYATIDALNREWGRQYASFDEVAPPKRDWDESPEWRNFWKFRRWSMEQQTKKACEMVRDLEPEHTTMGQKCKPDPVSTSWHPAADVDLFGGVGPPPFFGAGARFFSKALTQGGGYWDCPYAWVDGRRQLDHKPKERRYMGRELLAIYNDMISRYFQGTKGFWNEEYNDGVRHMFHRTTLIQRDAPLGKIKTWFGDIVFFDDEAYDYAPVTACIPPLRFSRAVQLGYRLGPLFLPARPIRGSVAVVMTEDSWLIQTGAAGNHDWLAPLDGLLRRLHVPYDILRPENIDTLKDYPVAILAGFTESADPALVEALKRHVARGGKVILFDHALGFDARTLSEAKPAPAFGFHQVAGCTYAYDRWPRTNTNSAAVVTGGKFLKTLKPGDVIASNPNFSLQVKLVPGEASTVVAKLDDQVVGVMSADGSVLTLSLPSLRVDWRGPVPPDENLISLVGDVLASWGLRRPLETTDGALRDVELRAMAGDGYWLAAVMNHADAKQKADVTLAFLPDGTYDVVDVTGERPILVKNEKKELHLAVDGEFRESRWVARNVGAAELASKGLTLEVDGLMARVLLIRPAGLPVWVNAPAEALRTLAARAGAVVVGDDASPAELAAANRIIEAAKPLGAEGLVLRRASEVQVQKTRTEVRVSPTDVGKPKTPEDGYLVDVFENAPLAADVHLIVVGNAGTNGLIKHLAAPGTFTYDKMLEKVTAEYPGKGRGLIELVECINRPAYDTSSTSRDAIVVGGSDDAGTAAAAERLVKLLEGDKR